MSEQERIRDSIEEWRRKSQEQQRGNGSTPSRLRRFCRTVLLALFGSVAAFIVSHYWPHRPLDVDFGSGACFVVVLGMYVVTRNRRIAAATFLACWADSIWWVANPPTDPSDWLWLAHFTALGLAELALLRLWEDQAVDPLSVRRHAGGATAALPRIGRDGRWRATDWLRSRFPGSR